VNKQEAEDLENEDQIRGRLGEHLYRQRVNLQRFHAAQIIGPGRSLFHPENLPLIRILIRGFARCFGVHGWGIRNARDIRINTNKVALPGLAPSFHGLRILQLSDLHLDIDPAITDALLERLVKVDYDLCVITGDYRAETTGDPEACFRETERVMAALHQPVYGILGNHDFIEMTPRLEAMGIHMLINEQVVLEREEDRLVLAGVDDPHFYETDDFEDALRGAPEGAPVVMLSHTAEPYRQALAAGVGLMLCGHTHGGQLCLPGGVVIMHNARHPRWMNKGPWRYHHLQGYTATGIGCSIVPMRYFCPPEITIHVLESAAPL